MTFLPKAEFSASNAGELLIPAIIHQTWKDEVCPVAGSARWLPTRPFCYTFMLYLVAGTKIRKHALYAGTQSAGKLPSAAVLDVCHVPIDAVMGSS